MIHATEHKSAVLLTLRDAASLWHLQNSEMHAFLYLKDVTGSILFWAIYMINMVPEVPVFFPGSFCSGVIEDKYGACLNSNIKMLPLNN